LPRYAPWAARLALVANLVSSIGKPFIGFAAQRTLPKWRGDYFREKNSLSPHDGERVRERSRSGRGSEVLLFVDTFNRYFEPENARAALAVLEAAGYSVHLPRASDSSRPLCCGRTFLASGLVDEAKR